MEEYLLIIFLIILLYIIFIVNNNNNLVLIESNSGTKYLVNNDDDKYNKSNLINNIIINMLKLKDYLVENSTNFPEYTIYIKQLNTNFSKEKTKIYETDPKSDLTSYSINKGEELSLCLKSKKTNQLHDINLLMYVSIHEMAHFACPEIGHGDLFKNIFKFLIEQAIKINVYQDTNYVTNPIEYCGMILNSSINH
jgi:predicted metal-dependent hydrolase